MIYIDIEDFQSITEEVKREEVNNIAKYLRTLPHFQNLHPAMARKLAKSSTEMYFNKNQIVYNQGDKSENIHVVLEGQFIVNQKTQN